MNYLKIITNYFLICFLATNFLYAQGGAAAPFLVESPDARFSGMGEAGTAVADDINATYWNPGGLGFLKETRVKKDYSAPYFEGSYSFFFRPNPFGSNQFLMNETEGIRLKSVGVFALDFNYENTGEMQQTFEDGRLAKKFTGIEFCVGLAYGRQFGNDFGIGLKLKYINSSIAPVQVYQNGTLGTASGYAFDLGVLWNPDFGSISDKFLNGKFFSVGLNLQNIGPKMTYRQESDPLPTNLRLGIALKLMNISTHKLTFALDAVKLLIKRDAMGSDPLPKSLVSAWSNPGGMTYCMGIEYWEQRYLGLRCGYFYEPEKSGGRKYFTFGASGRVYIFQADLSFLKAAEQTSPLTDIFKFTLKVGG